MKLESDFIPAPKKGLTESLEPAIEETDGSRAGSFTSALLAVMLVAAAVLIACAALILASVLFEYASRFATGSGGGSYAHHFLYAFLIALANNVDNLGARISYSMQGTRVSKPVNLWISLITFAISSAAAFAGGVAIGPFGAKTASIIAMAILVVLGSWMIFRANKEEWPGEKPPEPSSRSLWTVLSKPHHADMDDSKHIDFKEATILGIALSINNIGGGLIGGVIGINPFLLGSLAAIISFLALWGGNYVADFFVKRRLANKVATLGGVLLIAIGVKQIF
jgi:putative sporulation protein YtaF